MWFLLRGWWDLQPHPDIKGGYVENIFLSTLHCQWRLWAFPFEKVHIKLTLHGGGCFFSVWWVFCAYVFHRICGVAERGLLVAWAKADHTNLQPTEAISAKLKALVSSTQAARLFSKLDVLHGLLELQHFSLEFLVFLVSSVITLHLDTLWPHHDPDSWTSATSLHHLDLQCLTHPSL